MRGSDETTTFLGAIRSQIKQVSLIKEVPAAMRTRVILAFLGVAEDRVLPAGTRLFTQDERSEEIGYLMLRGRVEIQKEDGEVLTCTNPELLGEMQMFNPRHVRAATVTVTSETMVLKFSWGAFFHVAEELFDADEMKAFRECLASLAWEHFTV